MKVSPITNQTVGTVDIRKTNKAQNVSNLGFKGLPAGNVEGLLRSVYGISADFEKNDFVANCIMKIVSLFENLYGKNSLPKEIMLTPVPEGLLGYYYPLRKQIGFNANSASFDNMQNLIVEAKSGQHLIFDDYSTAHPAGTFVHEFSHSAHRANIDKHGRNGIQTMEELRRMQIPTSVGRLITKFKLGRYSLDRGGGLNEFMAERATKDICKGLSEYYWLYKYAPETVKYDDIFSRKWNCRYSTPQAFLDYYTQQIWNGDIKESERAAGMIERYLEEIDRTNPPVSIKQKNLSGLFDALAGKFTNQANWLDEKNKLKH